MRRSLVFAAAPLLLANPARAANYIVNAGGGGDFTTIQACANAMTPGDFCRLTNRSGNVAASGIHLFLFTDRSGRQATGMVGVMR